MKNINRRNFFKVSIGSAAVLSMPKTFASESVPYADLKSEEISAMFGEFAKTKKMPANLNKWLNDPVIQKIPPYKVFDNVWYVGLRWVASYLIKTSEGYILIDTVHQPFVVTLLIIWLFLVSSRLKLNMF